jgi:hypothetical protein
MYPVVVILADAYQYGVEKYGDGTWKDMTASEHIDKAVAHMVAWKKGETKEPVLIDAALRILFAASIAITYNMAPTTYEKQDAQTKS